MKITKAIAAAGFSSTFPLLQPRVEPQQTLILWMQKEIKST
jgi:hypothetical protein